MRKGEGRAGPFTAGLVAVAGAGLFVLLSWTAGTTKSATFDEGVHLLSGYRILTADDFVYNHEHPPLMKVIAAAPLVLSGAARPFERWSFRTEADEFPLAHQWLYHRNDADGLLRPSRLAISLSGALLALVLFGAVRAIMRPRPGRRPKEPAAAALGAASAAIFLLAVEPNLLAHAALVTTDMGMAVFFFSGSIAFWRYLETRRTSWMVLSGALWGLNLAAKFTGVLLGPVFVAMGCAWILAGGRSRGGSSTFARGDWAGIASALAVISVVALLVLSACYGFEGLFTPLRSMHLESERFVALAEGPLGGIRLPVPAPYVHGFDHASAGGQLWWSYLMGEYSRTGWRHYHLVALAVKTSIPLMALALAGLLMGGRRGEGRRAVWIGLALPPSILLAAFTLSSNVKNIGVRYVIAVLPFLCALGGLGAVALWRHHRIWGRAAAAVMLAWAGAAEASAWPDHLAYFNLVAGGPDGGRRWLVDSNLDWGQDLKGLGIWMRENDVESIYLDYFGRACPAYEGVRTRRDFQGGLLAVSVTNLSGVYRPAERGMYDFLLSEEPVASIGHSILVYEVPRPPGWPGRPGTPQR